MVFHENYTRSCSDPEVDRNSEDIVMHNDPDIDDECLDDDCFLQYNVEPDYTEDSKSIC